MAAFTWRIVKYGIFTLQIDATATERTLISMLQHSLHDSAAKLGNSAGLLHTHCKETTIGGRA
jgi:hypothetical protein